MFELINRENKIFEILQEFINAKLDFIIIGGYAVSAFKHRFSVDVDIRPPAIVRAYFSNNQLKVITNENAECKYADNQGISFENKQDMFDIKKEHTAPWQEGSLYYVECVDGFGNHAEINLEAYQIVGV